MTTPSLLILPQLPLTTGRPVKNASHDDGTSVAIIIAKIANSIVRGDVDVMVEKIFCEQRHSWLNSYRVLAPPVEFVPELCVENSEYVQSLKRPQIKPSSD